MVLALAQHQLQQFEAARATLSRGLQLAADKLGDADRTDLDDTWNDWLIARCLLREARAAVSGTAGNAPASAPRERGVNSGSAAKARADGQAPMKCKRAARPGAVRTRPLRGDAKRLWIQTLSEPRKPRASKRAFRVLSSS